MESSRKRLVLGRIFLHSRKIRSSTDASESCLRNPRSVATVEFSSPKPYPIAMLGFILSILETNSY
jgi:hypothetical protein